MIILNYETNQIKTLICRDENTNAIELSPKMPSSKGFQDMKPIDIKVNNHLFSLVKFSLIDLQITQITLVRIPLGLEYVENISSRSIKKTSEQRNLQTQFSLVRGFSEGTRGNVFHIFRALHSCNFMIPALLFYDVHAHLLQDCYKPYNHIDKQTYQDI